MISPDFLLTSLVVVLLPGTGVLYTVSTGLFYGGRASLAAASGCTLGILPHLTASVLGLSAILHMSAVAFQAVKLAGAAYLLYLAWSMWRETGALSLGSEAPERSAWTIVRQGFLINILNPKLSIFFLAFLPLFVDPGAPSAMLHMVGLSAVFMAMTLVIFMGYGLSAHGVRRYVLTRPGLVKGMQRSFAAVFALLGIRLALAER